MNNATADFPDSTDSRSQLCRSVYAILIFLSAGVMLGRILAVDSVDKIGIEKERLDKVSAQMTEKQKALEAQGVFGEALQKTLGDYERHLQKDAALQRPFLSANDRSRWCTVRALVEPDMQVKGMPYAIDHVIQERNWDTIDMVKHDGHLYSSKPPLLPTLMAAVYWPIYHTTGMTLGTHPYEIGRFMLILFNVVPLLIGFVLLAALVERFGTTDWGRIFVMAAAVFGTFLTTFAVVINNHVPAAVCIVIATYAAVRIRFDGEQRLRYFVVAGLFSALAAANEFPAAAFFAVLVAVLLWQSWRSTFFGFLPAVLVIGAAFFGTNWIAHQSLTPAYMHRSSVNKADNWYDYTFERNGRPVESYWNNPQGFDRGEPSQSRYALHVLVGHHGIFSLTPIWLLSFVGIGVWLFHRIDPRMRWMAAAIALVSLACIAFYLARPSIERNYGGVTSGLRWLFWLTPLWLLSMLPVLDFMSQRRWSRGLALVLLAASALSASYPTWNPWTQSWLTVFWRYLGVAA